MNYGPAPPVFWQKPRRAEVQENQELALKWFKRAVDLDPYCYEAVERLLGNHLLNAAQESAAGGKCLSSLSFFIRFFPFPISPPLFFPRGRNRGG